MTADRERAELRGFAAIALVLFGATACGPDAPSQTQVYGPPDGTSYPVASPLRVGADGVLLRPTELALVTWPENVAVPWAIVEVGLQPGCETTAHDGCSSFATIDWSASDEHGDRWYAVRWTPASDRAVVIDHAFGILLADGSHVWRVYRGSMPMIDVIGFDAPSVTVYAGLTEEVRLRVGHSPYEPVFTVTQGGATCTPVLAGERHMILSAQCPAGFDFFAPMIVHVPDVWESLAGVPLPPADLRVDVEPGETGVDVGGDLVPPPVPAELCGGFACDE